MELEIEGPSYKDVYVLPESVLQEHFSVWVVEDGVLKSFVPQTLGHTSDGWVVEVFDAGKDSSSAPSQAPGKVWRSRRNTQRRRDNEIRT